MNAPAPIRPLLAAIVLAGLPLFGICSAADRLTAPSYPRLAQVAQIEGIAGVRVQVGADGWPRGFATAGHPLLISAVIQAVERNRLSPGDCAGQSFELTFRFTIGPGSPGVTLQSPAEITVRDRSLGLTVSHDQGPKSGTCVVEQLERPEYPQAVKTARISGPISARITVDPDGYLQAELRGATVYFGKAVETALAKTRLSPADCAGKVFDVSYRFGLDPVDEPGAGSFAAFHAPGEFEIREVLPKDEIVCIVYSRPTLWRRLLSALR